MKRTALLAAIVALVAAFHPASALARGAAGKVVAVEGDKITVQLEPGKVSAFSVGMRDVEVKAQGGATVRGRIMAIKGDRITLKAVRGKASSIPVGAAVEVGQAADAGAEGVDGC